ncbi:SusC/RagA family TonB-linked outer membrane protein [Litoribacter alkaliphilus]|uniref:SusC/RagA family TonB-linked outer membrane protein n=1 Tax=Litoribacter ruber TaxID=702568 RepID=A0AAP2CLE3_9BACT|nr:SusC/RagA family TonB-linked outer membrane protein [Litoribacter alkaliphilus]MBS9523992.1 SusC/RagA family TonB-linked outer membrane protein [Litoribacter alkaliphilus]
MKNYLLSMKVMLLFLALFITAETVYAQGRQITGTVISGEDMQPLPGVAIQVKGTSRGTVTDMDGKFSLDLQGGETTLVVSFIGFTTQEVSIGNLSLFTIALEENIQSLSETVVIGYGQQRAQDATGAVIALGEEKFNKGIINSPEQLLQGRAAGVQVTPSSGEPGAAVNIRIRGTSSVRSDNNPLFVIDGVPLDGAATQAGGADYGAGGSQPRNPLNFLNPDDIESISVLKDASAAAIYGSRGSNGVVLITTKKGKAGQESLTFSTSASVSTRARKIDLLDANDYIPQAVAAGADENVINFGGATDWQDEIFRTAITQNYNVGYGGGTENTQYRVSLSYMNQDGIIRNTGLERITGRINASHKVFDDRLRFDLQLTASDIKDTYAPLGEDVGFEGNLIGAALQANPTRPIRNADGTFQQSQDFRNPVAMLAYIDDRGETTRVLGNIGVTFNFTDNFFYKMNFGMDNSSGVRRTSLDQRLVFPGIENIGRGVINNTYQRNQLIEHTLNYNGTLGENRLEALLGFSYQKFESRGHFLQSQFFTLPNVPPVDNMGGVDNVTARAFLGNSFRGQDELQSFFGRVNYNIRDKYLITATLRADGSSKFGEDNKYGVFPSLAAAWRINEEDFMSGSTFNDLKLRAGWGVTGNQEFPRNAAVTVLRADNQGGTFISNQFNPNLRWEETVQYNVGFDFAIMQSKLTGAIDYFNKQTENLLILVDFPAPANAITRWENLPGRVINEGVEFTLDYLAIDRENFSWNILGNATFLRNDVQGIGTTLNTGNIDGQGLTGAFAQRITDGQPLYSFYMRDFEGFTEDGLGIYRNNEELFYLGSPFPTFTWGLTNNFAIGRFDASVFFNGQNGGLIYNNTANAIFLRGNLANGRNVTREIANSGENPANFGEVSSRFLESSDFVRLANLNLGYTFNMADSRYIRSMRVGFTGQNLLLFTGYSGFDPEVNTNKARDGVPSLGIDYTAFPLPRIYTLNLNFGF